MLCCVRILPHRKSCLTILQLYAISLGFLNFGNFINKKEYAKRHDHDSRQT